MTALAVPRETKVIARPPRPVASLDDILLELVDIDDNVRDDVGELDELQASIAELGLLSPVKVTAQPDGRYKLVYGQRRVLACRALGRTKISAIVEPASEVDQVGARRSIEQLAENLQRKDLNPIEEAVALREVLDADPTLTQEALADQLAMSRPWVSNTLGLLEAAPAIQDHIRAGRLTASHAKAVRGLPAKTQAELADQAVERGYSAHAFEDGVQRWKQQQDWQKESAQRTRRENDERRARQVAAVEKLAKTAPLDAPIHVGGGWYGKDQIAPVAKLLRGAGFTKVVEKPAVGDRPKKGEACSCTAWKVEIGYSGSLSIGPACIVQAHQDAVYKAERAAEAAAREAQDRIKDAVQAHVTEQALHLDPVFARILLWIAFDWSLNDWVRDHKGDRKKPDAWDEISSLPHGALAAELATFIRKGFTDRYNVKLDWDRIAREIGVVSDLPEPAPATPVKGKKAAPAFTAEQARQAAAELEQDLDG